MALPVQSDIVTMDYPSRGLPYCDVPASSTVDTQTMDYPSRGLPLVTNPYGAGTAVAGTNVSWRNLLGVGL